METRAPISPQNPHLILFFDVNGTIINGDHVFESFIRLLVDLEQSKRQYTLVLRSFGLTKDILEEIENRSHIKFKTRHTFKEGKLMLSRYKAVDSDHLLSLVKPQQHAAWDEDSVYFSKHKFQRPYGKQFPVNLDDYNTLSIFFDDDNYRVSPRLVGRVLDSDKTEKLFNHLVDRQRIVIVDTTKADLDPDYFRKKVYQAINLNVKGKNELPPLPPVTVPKPKHDWLDLKTVISKMEALRLNSRHDRHSIFGRDRSLPSGLLDPSRPEVEPVFKSHRRK